MDLMYPFRSPPPHTGVYEKGFLFPHHQIHAISSIVSNVPYIGFKKSGDVFVLFHLFTSRSFGRITRLMRELTVIVTHMIATR